MSTTLASGGTKPPVDFDQEVRFAVVMYGGASLAIYINGVAQELLRLVRATAPEFGETPSGRQAHLADEELRGSERVYRRLGRLLSRQGIQRDENHSNAGGRPIRTRFVVDILTGTSAGGINAVYLAKALANEQDMDELHNLWLTEGDIAVLLNDKISYTDDLRFKIDDEDYKGEPWSLLNSRRIHLRLLKALRGMETTRKQKQGEPTCPRGESPLVDELDLFVTATDMAGLVLKLRLADKVASEYRHRNVFRFRYRGKRATASDPAFVTATDSALNEFGPENNAFLAFAARATSAHQAAFSPVKFNDSTHIVAKHISTGEHPVDAAELRVFYQDYLLQRAGEDNGATADPDQLAAAFRDVWFVDGGTLDNKPFSFVAQQLPLRHAETFVDRKLLYVEPSPEHLKRVQALNKERPRIKENALAALSSLPRYETIVEDLTRLLDRNRLVERLRHIMLGAEEDLLYGLNPKQERTRGELRRAIADRGELMEWLREKGPGWGSYQRLRVAEVTDDLTLLVARAAGFSEESDEFIAIRLLVRDWRDRSYDAHMEPDPDTGKARKSQLEFLIDFDLPWAMRRVRFVLGKLNDLACLDAQAKKIAEVARRGLTPEWPDRDSEKEFRAALREMRKQLNEAFLILRSGRRMLWSRDYETNPFRSAIASLELTSANLLGLLRQPTDTDRRDEAQRMLSKELTQAERRPELRTRNDAVDALTHEVRQKLANLINKARGKCSDAMRPPEGAAAADAPRWELFLRQTLFYYYKYFEDFDQISYPILYSTGVGEEIDEIDVFRVSPVDATALIDESKKVDEKGQEVKDGKPGRKIEKLAGTTLANFGAFLRDKFRINDILWGRLDGAERVIAALLPADKNLCKQMTQRAHRAIIVEDMLFADKDAAEDRALQGAIWDALDAWDDPQRRTKLLGDAAQRLPQDSAFRLYVEELKRDEKAEPINLFREAFFKNYKESRHLEEDASIESVKRAQSVLSGMVLHYFPEKEGGSKLRRLVMWLGKRLRILIEAAIEPEGEARIVQERHLSVAYVTSVLILAFVCLPVILMMFATQWPWPGLGFLAILFLTLPFALLPLVVTLGYNLASLKLRGKIEALLLRLRGT